MTLTELYKGVDLETLNMILEAQGANYEFYREGEEVKYRVKERGLNGVSVTESRRDRVQSGNGKKERGITSAV